MDQEMLGIIDENVKNREKLTNPKNSWRKKLGLEPHLFLGYNVGKSE